MFEFMPLGKIAALSMGETIIASDCDGAGFPIYSADTSHGPWMWSTKIKRLNARGTIIVGARGSIGFPRLPDADVFGATQTTITVRPHAGLISARYLFHALRSFDFTAITAQQAVPMLTVAEFSDVRIRSPSLAEQGAIVEVLDTLDIAIHATEALIAKLKAVKQGLLHDLLTRGIDASGELRPPQSEAPHLYKASPLGWIPKSWDAMELNDLVDPKRPVVYGILMPGYGCPGGVPVIKVKDIIGGQIRQENLLLTSPQIDREYSRSRLSVGDLLFTIRGTVGRTAFVPEELHDANITQDSARLSIKGVDPRFVRAYLQSSAASRFVSIHTLGVAVQGINLRDVRRIPMAKPPNDESKEISDRLMALDARVQGEGEKMQNLKLEKQGLMDDLLTGRVRVTPLLDTAIA